MAGSVYSSPQNHGLADWPRSGNRYVPLGHPAAVGLGPVKLMILSGQHRCDSVVSTVRLRSRLVARNEAGALVWAWLAEETMGRPLVDLLNSARP